MDKDKLLEIVDFFRKRLEEKIHVSKLILFGSQLTGNATEESDIDIIIVSEDFEGKNIFERAELTKDAEIQTLRAFSIPIDIIDMTPKQLESGDSLKAAYAKLGISV